MTKTPIEPKTEQVKPTSSQGWFAGLLVLIFRLLLLGVGGVTAILVGMAIASIAPGDVEQTPLLERFFRQVMLLRQTGPQGPGALIATWWPGEQPTDSEALAEWWAQSAAQAEAESASEAESGSSLAQAERQAIQDELEALQEELTQLGDPPPATPEAQQDLTAEITALRDRMATLEQRLESGAFAPAPPPPPIEPVITDVGDRLRLTFPSQDMFEDDGVRLTAQGEAALGRLAQVIGRYPGRTVLVSSYTDSEDTAARNRQTSFEQAQVVHLHLVEALDDGSGANANDWFTVGYGQTEPTSAPSDATLTQRIEVDLIP